ncbi:tetratricopeptide (TPR) repeat protein [Clostridium pascui]|uniref:tetratricopeptide repeat protein n=1 Tax=Clostridium pascui TaxID=46609 RepID=UPI001FAEB88D|nr:tetratricopeptide repeat protein [Clostridium pascui]MBM7869651.1 tetratricopeptide (TPR) repeat protein [Clostridium pascui]
MWSKLSLKNKVIFFSVLSIVSAIFIFNGEIKNKIYISDSSAKKTEVADDKAILKSDKGSSKIDEQVGEEKDKENKELEEIYEKAYKAFFDNKYTESINLANEVIKKDNSHYKSYNIKGIALAYMGSFEEGMKNINKALEISPNYGYARFNKALAYELYDKYDEALKWYDKNLEVENYIWSYYGKASIYGRKGDVKNTVKYLKIAIEMDNVVKEEARAERDFDNVRQSKEFQELIK